MRVLSLGCRGFRNLEDSLKAPLEFSPSVNVLFGENGQGKTNFLEAIWLFTGGRSFRGAKDGELICRGQQEARLSLEFFSEERQQKAGIALREGKRFLELNGVKKRSASQMVGAFCAVIFSPEHLSLLKGGPALRRQFLDSAVCQCKPAFAPLLSRYNRTVFQRNALLKDIPRHPELLDTLEIWDQRLARLGEEITRRRQEYLEGFTPLAENYYRGISSGRETLSFGYRPGYDGSLEQALSDLRREDLRLGHTAAGPHRGDLEIFLNGVPAKSFASQGQQRSAVLAMKLAEADMLCRFSGEEPVVLLDDVLSELDQRRQEYLLNHLENRQVFLTCCSPEPVLHQGLRFQVREGKAEGPVGPVEPVGPFGSIDPVL